jgi:glutaredoxin-like protein
MFLDDKLKSELQKKLSPLKKRVKLILFAQELDCQYCKDTQRLLHELSETTDMLELEVKNLILDKNDAKKYNIDKTPAIVMLDEEGKDHGIKFYGIPSGYEFSSLLEDILLIGTGEHGLSDKVVEQVKSIKNPVHLQIFVTPTCPYCPQAVITGHMFSYLNNNIQSDMIEASEFPQLSYKYNVRGVPRTVINEDDFIEGAAPVDMFLNKILLNLDKVSVN